jgi:hypothetical protein
VPGAAFVNPEFGGRRAEVGFYGQELEVGSVFSPPLAEIVQLSICFCERVLDFGPVGPGSYSPG